MQHLAQSSVRDWRWPVLTGDACRERMKQAGMREPLTLQTNVKDKVIYAKANNFKGGFMNWRSYSFALRTWW
jgi:hypothetical protein